MFNRNTSAPASIKRPRISVDSVAGPSVQMIFVLRIPGGTIPLARPQKSKPVLFAAVSILVEVAGKLHLFGGHRPPATVAARADARNLPVCQRKRRAGKTRRLQSQTRFGYFSFPSISFAICKCFSI